MASVNAVYRGVKDLVNKDQNGFISPAVFNSFAQVAQLRIFNRLFSDIKDAKRVSKAGFNPGRDKSRFKQIEEDLSYFARTDVLTKDATTGTFLKSGLNAANPDLSRLISITTNGSVLLGDSTRTIVDMCYDEDKIERILLSDLSKPNESAPVALISQNIEVFPDSIQRIRVRYYRYPSGLTTAGAASNSLPTYEVTVAGGVEVFNSASSIDFELPDHYLDELILEIAEMAGINMRDASVTNAAQSQQVENKQSRTF